MKLGKKMISCHENVSVLNLVFDEKSCATNQKFIVLPGDGSVYGTGRTGRISRRSVSVVVLMSWLLLFLKPKEKAEGKEQSAFTIKI